MRDSVFEIAEQTFRLHSGGMHKQITFKDHLKATIWLGVPLVAMQITQMLITVVDTIMLGWLSVEALAAGTLAFQVIFLVYIFGLGFAAALMPLVAGALGRDDARAVRRSARMGLWALSIVMLAFMGPLLFAEQLLLLLGQEPELAALAADYLLIAQWSLIPAGLLAGLRNFLASLERTREILLVTIFAAVLNAGLNYMLIFGKFGAPRLEMEGAAIATVLANAAALFIMVIVVWRGSSTRHYEVFSRIWRPDWPAFGEIMRLGLPISLMILAEAGLFSAASIMMGWFGTVSLAAHGIALQIASLAFMVPLGLQQVATVRVGNAAGRGDWQAVGDAGYAAIVLTLGFTLVSGAVFVFSPEPLIRLFLDWSNPRAAEVLAYAIPLIWMAAAFQIVDGMQAIGGGALRGLKDTKIPLIIATIAYWPVGLGVAWFLSDFMGFGGIGVWAGLVAGLAAAAILLVSRFVWRERAGLTENPSAPSR